MVLSPSHKHAVSIVLMATFALVGCAGGGGGNGESGSGGGLSALPAAAPAIPDDDAAWLCGSARPERPKDGALGLRIAGVNECMAGQGTAVAGADLYVSVNGNDNELGDDPSRALRTIAEALCRVQEGQIVHVLPGVYQEGIALGALDGRGGATTIIRGEPTPTEPVVLEGDRWRTIGIGLVECWNVRVENFTIRHYSDAGIWALLGGDLHFENLEIVRCGRCSVEPDVEGEGFGINVLGVEGYAVRNCRFEDNGPLLASVLRGDVLGTAINTFESNHGTISGNEIRLTRGGGILIEDGANITVSGNTIVENFLLAYDNYSDGGIWIDGSRDVLIRDNTIEDNYGGAGVEISDEEGRYPTSSTRIELKNNTIRNNLGAGVALWGYGSCPPPADAVIDFSTLETDNTITDNLFQSTPKNVWCDPSFIGGELPEP